MPSKVYVVLQDYFGTVDPIVVYFSEENAKRNVEILDGYGCTYRYTEVEVKDAAPCNCERCE